MYEDSKINSNGKVNFKKKNQGLTSLEMLKKN